MSGQRSSALFSTPALIENFFNKVPVKHLGKYT
jgi:hypothetical protein